MKLIVGKINAIDTTYYWNINEETDFKIGDYAIVENKSDYDLVKIVGIVETTEEYVKYLTNKKVNKNVKYIISALNKERD